MKRCQWAYNEYLQAYHDNVWGKPQHDERQLYKMLILEGLQAGLSWEIILKKEPFYDQALDHFDYHLIALYDQRKYEELMHSPVYVDSPLAISATEVFSDGNGNYEISAELLYSLDDIHRLYYWENDWAKDSNINNLFKGQPVWCVRLGDKNDPLTNLYIYVDATNGNVLGAGKASD